MPKKAVEPIDLTVENLPKMTVVMLKNILESKDLPIAGKKADLIERLTAYLQESSGEGHKDAPKSPVNGDKPASPVKITSPKPSDHVSSPVKETKPVPASPAKETVQKPASPVKESKPASPIKEVLPKSPVKISSTPAPKPVSPPKPSSPGKEVLKSPVKADVQPKDTNYHHIKLPSPKKDDTKPVSPVKQLPPKPASPFRQAPPKPAALEIDGGPLETPHHHLSPPPPASPKKDVHLHKRPTEDLPSSPSKKPKIDLEGPNHSSVHIQKFSRPLNVESLKQKLESISPLVDFWMDKIRSNCYARFANEDEARKVYIAMDKSEFQAGNVLDAKIVSNRDAEVDMQGQEASSAVSVVPPAEFLRVERSSGGHDRRDVGPERRDRDRDRSFDRRDGRDRDRDRHMDRRGSHDRDRDRGYDNRNYRGGRGRDFNNRDRYDRDRYDNRDRPRDRDFHGRGRDREFNRGGGRGRDFHNRDRFDRDRSDRDRHDRDKSENRDRYDDRPRNDAARGSPVKPVENLAVP